MPNKDNFNNEEKNKKHSLNRLHRKPKDEAVRDQERLERAKKIANRKKAIKNSYESVESSVKRIASWFSATVDKFLFSRKYDKVISVVLAVIFYVTINFSTSGGIILDSTYTIESHPVTLNADLGVYEITGYDKAVDVVLTGKQSDISTIRSQTNTKVILDLSGYQTGEHTVKFTTDNFSNRVTTRTIPESATVTIRKKETKRFKLTHEYLNLSKMDERYYPEEPKFETTEVLVRASTKTLDEIAYIKALIDVENHTETFETEAPLYAYNAQGERMEVEIIPKIVRVEVPITSPSKTVKVTVIPEGIIPNDKSIESISLDHNSIELYGSPAVLEQTDEVFVKLDATKLERDTKSFEHIILPTGIRHASVSQVSLDIKLADTVSKVLKGLPVSFENNIEGYKTRLYDSEQADIDVEIFGAQNIIDQIDEENFGRVYFDMLDVAPGDATLELLVDTNHHWVRYVLEFTEIKMEVVSE